MRKMATREAYGKTLAELIIQREDVVVLDADLTKSTKTIDAKKACPQRHFNMGIAEGNMMGVAAGLAASNKVVYVSSFAMFAAGRAFEQIRNSIAYTNLNVNICATHAGISVGEDGASHQAIEDIAIMRAIPDMRVFQPCDAIETAAIIKGVADIDGPCYIRLGRLAVEDVYDDEEYTFTPGKGIILRKGIKVAIIASGMMVQEALKAGRELTVINPTIVNMPSIKPIDAELILELARTHEVLITCEEHSVIGGLGSAVADVLAPYYNLCRQIMIGVDDCFGESGKPMELLEKYGIDADRIRRVVEGLI